MKLITINEMEANNLKLLDIYFFSVSEEDFKKHPRPQQYTIERYTYKEIRDCLKAQGFRMGLDTKISHASLLERTSYHPPRHLTTNASIPIAYDEEGKEVRLDITRIVTKRRKRLNFSPYRGGLFG
jgi:hypothetical protein